MDEYRNLENRIKALEAENRYLKEIFEKAGVNYRVPEDLMKLSAAEKERREIYDPDQGARILPRDISEEDANKFFSMFWGRTDVYSKRTVKKSTGEVNYYTQCYNYWKPGCPRIRKSKIRCQDCERQAYRRLGKAEILAHLRGKSEASEDVIGIYPLFPDETCRFLVFDFDNHGKNAEKYDFANADDDWKEEVDTVRKICEINQIDALAERSRSGKGAHLWIFFQKPVKAKLARRFGDALLRKGMESVNLKSFRYFDRMIPMQDHLPKGGLGNLIALPLQGQALKSGNSAFIDENWNAYPDQWGILFGKKKLSEEFLEEKIKEWESLSADRELLHFDDAQPEKAASEDPVREIEELFSAEDEKPWERKRHFDKREVDGRLNIVLSDGVYVDTSNLKAMIQNQIRNLALFPNPVFHKNQAMGLSNFNRSRFIYLGRDENRYIRIPRGLLENVIAECKAADIQYVIQDERCAGRELHAEFSGELKETQIPAAGKMLQNDTGILNAATAFGKTVVCCNIIARKKVNTLILLQSSALISQWENALMKFLDINEEPPEYETPSGRVRRRKSVIGKLQGAHDSTTGIIDIMMAGSVCKNGEYHRRLNEYGLVIVDECHHAASDTLVNVLEKVKAKYVYGVTATPFRGDGLEKISYMLLGPVRYKYTAKDRAKEQGIGHFVYPRFTRAVAPRFGQEKMHPNEAYEIIRNNDDRDDLIVNDVRKCIQNGRTPVVLSKYVDHSRKLYERLEGCADHVFLLSGKNSKKEHREILSRMDRVKREETMILVATGALIGEGFDFPRLDTLIMAAPVAWKGVVEQYAGRLNRDYEGKEDVLIYDYVDIHIPMFERMYHKRLRAYRQIGYEVCAADSCAHLTVHPVGTATDSAVGSAADSAVGPAAGSADSSAADVSGNQTVKSIFDIDNYREVYLKDLLGANREIIISSPAISGKKIEEIMELLREKQESGLCVRIVTWKADCYGYGDDGYWMELHERMRRNGFKMNLVEDYCDHYCIIDRELVWYGSMNFLGKEDSEDNLMRVRGREIAAELLELTFGKK